MVIRELIGATVAVVLPSVRSVAHMQPMATGSGAPPDPSLLDPRGLRSCLSRSGKVAKTPKSFH